MSLLGAALAYTIPFAFGLGVYLALVERPSRVTAAACAWGGGWLAVHLALFVPDQFLGVRLGGSWYGLVATSMAITSVALLVWRRERLRGLVQAPVRQHVAGEWPLLAPLLALVALIVYKALVTPPASTDAIVYHLTLPRETVETGSLPLRPGVGWLDLVTIMPGMLITQQVWIHLGAGGFDEVLVRPVVPVFSVLLLALVYTDTRRWWGPVPAAMAAGLLFTLNEFGALTASMWAEVPVAFFAWLGVRSALATRDGWPQAIGAGVFLGAAALTKYNGLVLVAAVAGALLLRTARARLRHKTWRGMRSTMAAPAVAAVVLAPLLLRNLLELGNPIYPAFFGGVNTATINALFVYPEGDALRIRLFEAVVLVGMLPVALLGVGWLRRRAWDPTERFLLLVVALFVAVFLYFPFRGSYIRYLAPVLPALAVLGGRQLAWWLTEASSARRWQGAAIMAGFASAVGTLLWTLDVHPGYVRASALAFFAGAAALVLLVLLRHAAKAPRTAVVAVVLVLVTPAVLAVAGERYPPRETTWDLSLTPPNREAYLEARFGDDWRMWQWMNRELPEDARVLTFESRTLYLEADVLFAGSHEVVPTLGMDLEEAVAHVRGLGVDHVLDSPWSHVPEMNRVIWERSVIFQQLGNGTLFRPVHAEGEVVLYALVE